MNSIRRLAGLLVCAALMAACRSAPKKTVAIQETFREDSGGSGGGGKHHRGRVDVVPVTCEPHHVANAPAAPATKYQTTQVVTEQEVDDALAAPVIDPNPGNSPGKPLPPVTSATNQPGQDASPAGPQSAGNSPDERATGSLINKDVSKSNIPGRDEPPARPQSLVAATDAQTGESSHLPTAAASLNKDIPGNAVLTALAEPRSLPQMKTAPRTLDFSARPQPAVASPNGQAGGLPLPTTESSNNEHLPQPVTFQQLFGAQQEASTDGVTASLTDHATSSFGTDSAHLEETASRQTRLSITTASTAEAPSSHTIAAFISTSSPSIAPVIAGSRVLNVSAGKEARARAVEMLRVTPTAPCALLIKGNSQPVVLTCDQALQRLAEIGNTLEAVLMPPPNEDPTLWARAVAGYDRIAAVEHWLGDETTEQRKRDALLAQQSAAEQAAAAERDTLHDTLNRWFADKKP